MALLPVFALLTVRHVQGLLTDRRFVLAMTLALTAQILVSTEVFATAALFGGLALVAAYLLFRERRVGQSKMSRKIFLEAVTMVWKLRFTV